MRKKLCLILTVILALTFMFAGCKSDSNKEVLRLGTNPEFPPFEFMGSDGEATGFDIKLMEEVAKELNMELKVESMEFKALIGAIETGSIDTIAAGMTVTDKRKESVDFSDTYYKAKQYVIVKKENESIKQVTDLNGLKIGVQEGTTGDFIASGDTEMEVYVEGATVSSFKKGVDAVMDLKNGKIDAVIIDSNPAQEFVNKNDDLKIVGEDFFPPEDYAIAVSKDKPELLKKINEALKKIKEDGRYDKLVSENI